MNLPAAESVNYWRTGTRSADAVLDAAVALIEDVGGRLVSRAVAWHDGREAILLAFDLDGESYAIKWPVLTPERPNATSGQAARRQAASFVYHSVKARVCDARVLGLRTAFLPFLAVEPGRTLAEVATPELAAAVPKMLPEGSP